MTGGTQRTVAAAPERAQALGRLDDAYLTEHLGDVLDKRRLKALVRRRDELLEN